MSRTNIVLGVSTAVFAATCGFLLHRLNADRALIEAKRLQIIELERKPPAIRAAAEQAFATPPAATEQSAPPVAANAAVPAGAPPPAPPPWGVAQRQPFENPQFRAAMLARIKVMTKGNLQDMEQWVRVSEKTMEQLITLMAEHSVEGMSNQRPAQQQLDAEKARQEYERRQQQLDVDILQLLGYEKFQQFKAYQQTYMARGSIQKMNERLPAEDALGSDRLRTVATVISEAQKSSFDESRDFWPPPGVNPQDTSAELAWMERRVELTKQGAESARSAAAAHLTSKQLQALDEVLQQRVESMKTALVMRRAQLGTQ